MKKLSLIYTIYSFKENEMRNIVSTYLKVKNFVKIVILSDNIKINEKVRNFISGTEITFVPSEGNIGKYQLIKNYISKGEETKWVKICDPDDIILYEELKQFIDFIEENNFNERTFFFLNPAKRISAGDWDSEYVNDNKQLLWTMSLPDLVYVNENSVFSWYTLKSFEFNFENQTKSSDVILSLSIFNGKTEIVEYNNTFYIYNFRNGLTATEEYSEKYFNEFLSFLKIMIRFKNRNPMPMPSMFDYLWAHNILCKSDFTNDENLERMSMVFNLLKDSSKDNFILSRNWDSKDMQYYKDKLIRRENILLED